MLSALEKPAAPGQRPPSKAAIKRAIDSFLSSSNSSHSPQALILPYIINYCEKHKIFYCLTAWPTVGYHIRRIDAAQEMRKAEFINRWKV